MDEEKKTTPLLGLRQVPKLVIAVDFDGVLTLSAYTSSDVVSGPPIAGAIGWLASLLDDSRLEVFLFTARAASENGNPMLRVKQAIRYWLLDNGLTDGQNARLSIVGHKVPAHVYIDDRGWRFDGTFPSVEELLAFRPWWDHLFPKSKVEG